MKAFLQKIFSVKNQSTHKIITILWIKLKFINTSKFLETQFFLNEKKQVAIKQQLIGINKLVKSFEQKFDDIEVQTSKLGQKLNKEFIEDNIANENYFQLEQEIYNFYEEMKARKFYPIFQNRISLSSIRQRINGYQKRFNKKIYILTDLDYIPREYNIIELSRIENYQNDDCMFVLIYNYDFNAINAVKKLTDLNLKYFPLWQAFPLARYFHTNELAFKVLLEESDNNHWHFCPVDFENIFQALEICKSLSGDYVEIGSFKGDSASAVLNYMKKANITKKSYFIDTFKGFDYEEAYNSMDAQWQNTHKDTSFEEVKSRLSKYNNASVVQANIITDSLPECISEICIANIDVDMYDAVKAALYKVKDKIVHNGIIIAEDYGHTPSLIGAQKAVCEFLDENPDMFIPIYLNSGQLFMIRK